MGPLGESRPIGAVSEKSEKTGRRGRLPHADRTVSRNPEKSLGVLRILNYNVTN